MASGNNTNELAQSLQNTSLPAKPENESKDTAYKRTENVANTITVEKQVVSRNLLLDNKVENKDEAFGGAKPKRGNWNSDRQKTNSSRRRGKQTFWYERQYSISGNKDREASKAEQNKDTRQKPTYSESTSFAYENSERRNSASEDKGNFLDKRIPIKADVTKLEGTTKNILHRTQLLNERIEESLYESGVRVVIKEGDEVDDLLMTDKYRACNIKENESAAKSLTKEEVHNVLSQYGPVEQICHTTGKKGIFWGKVTFTNESDAKAAVTCIREEADRLFTLVPITFSAYRPIRQQEITMKLSWTRRQGKGICYVCCNRTEDVSLLLRSKITVLDEVVTTRLSKHRQGAKPSDICIKELTLTVSEEAIKKGLANALGDEDTTDRFSVFIPREKCTLRTNEFELVQKELTGLLSKLSKPGAFQLYVREYKEQTVTSFALATFNDPEMCKDVAHKINDGYGYISGCKVRAEVEYKASVHVKRFLFDLLKEDINEKVEMYRTLCRSTTVEIRLLKSGNYSLDIKSTSLQNLAKEKVSLDKLVQGEELNGDAIHNIQALFIADNRATKMRIERSTGAIILIDKRRTQITVQGSTTAKDRAVELIRREVRRIESQCLDG
ncbi:uncharacterized protein LOC128220033 [Mya arenaria]|nr:uncharacterized protein LOC128220033 [Mya arenaria]